MHTYMIHMNCWYDKYVQLVWTICAVWTLYDIVAQLIWYICSVGMIMCSWHDYVQLLESICSASMIYLHSWHDPYVQLAWYLCEAGMIRLCGKHGTYAQWVWSTLYTHQHYVTTIILLRCYVSHVFQPLAWTGYHLVDIWVVRITPTLVY